MGNAKSYCRFKAHGKRISWLLGSTSRVLGLAAEEEDLTHRRARDGAQQTDVGLADADAVNLHLAEGVQAKGILAQPVGLVVRTVVDDRLGPGDLAGVLQFGPDVAFAVVLVGDLEVIRTGDRSRFKSCPPAKEKRASLQWGN